MGFEMLNRYCNCLLVTVRYPTGDLNPPSPNQNIGSLAAFIVLEDYGPKADDNNHYSILVPDPNTDPVIICPSASFTKEILGMMTPEIVPPPNTDPLVINHFNRELQKMTMTNCTIEFKVNEEGTDPISSPGCLSDVTINLLMFLLLHHYQTTEGTLVYMLSYTIDSIVRMNGNQTNPMTESFGNKEVRHSWWGSEQTTDSKTTFFTEEEKRRFYGTEFFIFAVPWNFHWVLAIVCFAGKCVYGELFPDKEPCVFFFDSKSKPGRLVGKYKKSGMTLGEIIYAFLNIKFSTKFFTSRTMPVLECVVPQQANGKDCGVCVLIYTEFILQDPNIYYTLLRHNTTKLQHWFGSTDEHFLRLIWDRRNKYYLFLTDRKASVEGFRERFVNVQNEEVQALIVAANLDKNPGT